ncbi:MAG TPA: hypothetical protein PLE70_04605 [Methanolinea sp.]|nr:hypothetical protein [Methanolinea sp.]
MTPLISEIMPGLQSEGRPDRRRTSPIERSSSLLKGVIPLKSRVDPMGAGAS